jgi:hypothetical protein
MAEEKLVISCKVWRTGNLKWMNCERNYEKYDWYRNDKTSGKVLKDNMKSCKTRCDNMKEDKFS